VGKNTVNHQLINLQPEKKSMQNPNGQYVTVQGTSKNIKIAQLVGSVSMILGVVTCSSHQPEAAAYLLLFGFFISVGAKVAKWWYHD
jgi:hypothetical protein